MPQLKNVTAVLRCEEPSEFILEAKLGGVCGWSTYSSSIMACIAAMVKHKKEMH